MTKLFKGAALTVLAVLAMAASALVTVPAMAQELAPEHLALARKYVELTDRSAIYEVTMVETGLETRRALTQQNPEIGKEVDDAIGKTLETYRGRKGELLDQFARVYALRFSMDELKQVVAFYESPVGVKLSTANQEINQDLQAIMQVFSNNTKVEFFAKVRAELKANGIDV